MRFQYYPETDSLYVKMVEHSGVDSLEVAPGVVLDFDSAGALVGIEMDNLGFNANPTTLLGASRDLPEELSESEREQVNLAFDQVLAGRYKLLDPIG